VNAVLLLGHRGARLYAAENTLESFELALLHGCDGFEFDVRCTADGCAVICHDPQLARLPVDRTPLARLRDLCPDLTTLDEVLARFAARAYLYIELKTSGLEDLLLAALAAHPPGRGYLVASFLPEVLAAVHARDASIPLGYNCYDPRLLDEWRRLPIGTVMPHWRLAADGVIDAVHGAGKQVFVWTVNNERPMRRLAASGVDAIISDDTRLLVRTLRALSAKQV